jgi:hypothetical protein
VGDFKNEWSYDANGNQTLEVSYQWDTNTNQWVNEGKTEYSYDANWNKTLWANWYDWDTTTNQWGNGEKYEYSYDANGNKTLYFEYYWDTSTNQWVGNFKDEYNFNNSFALSDLTLPNNIPCIVVQWWGCFVFYDDFSNMLLSYTRYWWDEPEVPATQIEYYFPEHTVNSAEQAEENKINVYPNPVTDYLNISLQQGSDEATFELFDINGRQQMHRKIKNYEIISLENLIDGIYFYRISGNNINQSGKLIKQ